MKTTKKIITLLSAVVLITVLSVSAFAITGDGTHISHTGGGSNVSGAYLVPSSDSEHLVGYRFSWLTKGTDGYYTSKSSLDVFYSGYNPNSSWGYHIKATINSKAYRNLSKYEYKRYFDSVSINREYYTASSYKYCNRTDIPIVLPADESAMTTWGVKTPNMNIILNEMVSGATVENMKATDFIFIEPIYRVKIENTNYCITVTEMGLIGCVVCSSSSTGNEGSGYGSGWVTIRRYTNYNWPDALKTTATHAGIAAGGTLSTSNYATFENLVKKGYGLMAVWNKTPHTLTVYYKTGTGASSLTIGSGYKLASNFSDYSTSYIRNSSNGLYTQTVNYDNSLTLMKGNSSGFNLTRNYYTFSKWKKIGTSTYFAGGASKKASELNSSVATGDATVDLEAVWTPINYTITYNLNGGKIGSSTTNPTQTYNYETNVYVGNYTSGETAYTVPTKAGYVFSGWKNNGSTVGYWSNGTVYQNKYNKGKSEHGNITLTAQWTPIQYTVEYYLDGVKQTSLTQTCKYGTSYTYKTVPSSSVTNNLSEGWYTGSSYASKGTKISGGGTFLNLTTTNGGTIKRYAYSYVIVYYRPNGGTLSSTYKTNSKNTIQYASDGSFYRHYLYYGTSLSTSGLTNASTFGLTKTGYTFASWMASMDTSKTYDQSIQYGYADFKDYANENGAVILLAKWTPNSYTVRYYLDGNEQTSLSQSCKYGTSYKYAAQPSVSSVTGYSVSVSAWWSGNSSASKGTQYTSGVSFSNLTSTNNGVVKRYAYTEKTPITYYVKYNGNGATSGSMSNSTHTYDNAQALTKNAFVRKFTVTFNYNGNGSSNTKATASANFDGWAKSSSASVTYTDEKSVKNLSSTQNAVVNLYAKWTDVSVTLPTPTRTGYVFSGWYTAASSGTKVGDGGTEYTPASNITLYARWTPITYIIRYNANGGTGTITDQTLTYDVAAKIKTNSFEKQNSTFVKWNTKADGTGTDYDEAQTVKNLTTVQGKVINLYAQWEENSSVLSLVPIVPNADYRETTSVITAFKLVNSSDTDCIPDDGINVVFKVYKNNTVIKTVTKTNVVVPKNDFNLLYFKWTVPELSGESIKITGEIVDGDNTYGNVSRIYSTCEYTISATPDTQYEASAPSGFTVPSLPSETTNTVSWKEWIYSDGAFVRKTYTLNLNSITATIKPAASANSWTASGKTYTKSGYGFEISATNTVTTTATSSMYVKPQYAVALFPEFGFSTANTKYRTLELVSSKWVFRENSTYGRVHFTPLWYPDGDYRTTVIVSDCWTPAGMVTRKINSNALGISGSAYDDWWID